MQLTAFRVTHYRNIIDSGWIDLNSITAFVGQNEAGKSNLFDALYRINPFVDDEHYNIDEDWPVDDWGNKDSDTIVCRTRFMLTAEQAQALVDEALVSSENEEVSDDQGNDGHPLHKDGNAPKETPESLILLAHRNYQGFTIFEVEDQHWQQQLSPDAVQKWAKKNVPNFVYINDYEFAGTTIELNNLANRFREQGWANLTSEEQTIKIIIDLAKIDLNDFLSKGQSQEGRTVRSFDKRAASSYLTKQFQGLWSQKRVRFDIDIDGTTLNIFAEDEAVGMPVRLYRRSNGFRWHVSFAWKFTHASRGEYKNCILLLEEPGIHLHYSGQRDLLRVFESIAESNTILYTTHLSSMVDLANPERVRIVEAKDTHATVKRGVVSSQQEPMAVIEQSLGLTGDMSGLLGNRKTLIVEGGDDALVLYKLSGLARADGKRYLSDQIYLWPARGASKTPMYAAFAVGQSWDSGVLLDTDDEGNSAKKKINENVLKPFSDAQGVTFRVFMIGESAGFGKSDAAIEDILGSRFYLECVKSAYRIDLKEEDLPVDGPQMITKRVNVALKKQFGFSGLDKQKVLLEMLKRFDGLTKISELPKETGDATDTLFKKINTSFGVD